MTAKLSDLDLSNRNFDDVYIEQADMTGTTLKGSTLKRASLKRIQLTKGDVSDANFREADLTGAIMRDLKAHRTNMSFALMMDADASRADWTDADLSHSKLIGTTMENNVLTRAHLHSAILRGATLTGSILSHANLHDADLMLTDLTNVIFEHCDVTNAQFSRANLSGCVFIDTDLRTANLRTIKEDFWLILSHARDEIDGLAQALRDGRVDGSTYTGSCACLIGTIANVRGVSVNRLGSVVPDKKRPAERWFLGILKGDTPENNQIAEITLEWIEEFLSQ